VDRWCCGNIASGVVAWHLTERAKPPERTPENASLSHKSKAIKLPAQKQSPQLLPKPIPPPNEVPQQTPFSPPPQTSPSPIPERWKFIGVSTKTGEEVYVDNSSIDKASGTIRFTYKIGNDLIIASADCDANRWYAKNRNTGEDYGCTSTQSQTTQSMMNHVFKS
jgi:hypothetical protein